MPTLFSLSALILDSATIAIQSAASDLQIKIFLPSVKSKTYVYPTQCSKETPWKNLWDVICVLTSPISVTVTCTLVTFSVLVSLNAEPCKVLSNDDEASNNTGVRYVMCSVFVFSYKEISKGRSYAR
jgi:hypothetical protein